MAADESEGVGDARDDRREERRSSEFTRYTDKALKVAEYTAAATTGVILVATGGTFLGTMIVTKSPKAAIAAAGKVLNFTTKHYKTIAGTSAVISGVAMRDKAGPAVKEQ
jgi:hypothetical protein